jgi:predicted PurR-regulated permease PerM
MNKREREEQEVDRVGTSSEEEASSPRQEKRGAAAARPELHPDPDPDIYRLGSRRQRGKPWGEWARLASAGAVAIILGLGGLAALRALGEILAVIFLGITIASALNPIVSRLERGKIPRAVAVIAIYALLLGLIIVVGFLIVPGLVNQVQQVVEVAPDALEALEYWINRQAWLLNVLGVEQIDEIEPLGALTAGLAGLGSALLAVPGAIATLIAEGLLMIFISIYGLILAHDLADYVASFFPEEDARNVLGALRRITDAMGGYLRGLLIDGSILGLVTYIGLMLIGVNFPLLLGVIAGMGEIVPIAGPVLAGSIIVLVALFQSPQLALITLIFVLILQQFESNILVPIVMKSQVDISPLFTLIAIAMGGTVGGFLGAVIAVPVAAAITALVKVAIAPAIRRRTGAPPRSEA